MISVFVIRKHELGKGSEIFLKDAHLTFCPVIFLFFGHCVKKLM